MSPQAMAVAAAGRALQASMVVGLPGRWATLEYYLTALRALQIFVLDARRHP